jgi:hypothetical protein
MKIMIIDFRNMKTYCYARPAMFFIDGKRVSKERYHYIRRNAVLEKHCETKMYSKKKGNIRREYQVMTVN